MQFEVIKASDWVHGDTERSIVEFNTLEELMQFQQDCCHGIILEGNHIAIYDDYIE